MLLVTVDNGPLVKEFVNVLGIVEGAWIRLEWRERGSGCLGEKARDNGAKVECPALGRHNIREPKQGQQSEYRLGCK
jgi:hypothetical protein